MAAIPRAIIAWNIRSSIDRAAMAELVLEVLPPAVPDGLEALPVLEVELLVMVIIPIGDDDDPTMDGDAVVDTDGMDDVAVSAEPVTEPELTPVGGGLALTGFASAPVPQGIALPSG